MTISEQNILAKTRAEEHEADVWGEFYIPPYFNHLSLNTATKSTYIVGKRGCGKTMLLKYLDYHTAFSEKRSVISDKEISHIGIYWRVDTQFCNSLNHRGIDEYEWIHPIQVGLLYDHRKKKSKRSKGVSIWHRYSIKIENATNPSL